LAVPGLTRKKKVKEGACIEYFNGKVYADKGGNTKELWYYLPASDTWLYLDSVGSGATAKGIKCGRSLASSDVAGGLYILIGNKTNELWFYQTGSLGDFARPFRPAVAGSAILGLKPRLAVCPNPTKGSALVQYSLPSKGLVTLRVYDVLGSIVHSEKSAAGYFAIRDLPAGVYLVQVDARDYRGRQRLVVVK
jgi:hypothetical protein